MKRYLLLLITFTRTSLIREISFKANFFANILVELAWTGVSIFGLEVMFYHTDSISGWTKGEVFLIYALYRLMSAIFAIIFRTNTRMLPELVNTGELDMLLTKPINTFFFVSTRIISINKLSQLIISLIILVYATSLINFQWNLWRGFVVLCLSITGSLIRYSISMSINTASIWLQKLQNLERLELVFFGAARFPRQAFPKIFSLFFTYVIPVMMVAAIPAEIILEKTHLWFILVAIATCVLSVLFTQKLFNFALRHYSSASS